MIGLVASFHTIIFAYGRQIYSLSRAGYYPRFMSITHGTRKTPYVALTHGHVIGLGVLLGVWFLRGPAEGSAIIGGTLLNMAVFGAMISYVLQGVSFILLRIRMPHIPRPYVSPFGIAGAALTIVIALWTMGYQLRDPAYLKGVYAAVAWYHRGPFVFRSRRTSPAGAVARGTLRDHARSASLTAEARLVRAGSNRVHQNEARLHRSDNVWASGCRSM